MKNQKLKLVGPERCDVQGLGVVKPGETIALPEGTACEELPGWDRGAGPSWWQAVGGKKGKAKTDNGDEDEGGKQHG